MPYISMIFKCEEGATTWVFKEVGLANYGLDVVINPAVNISEYVALHIRDSEP